MATIENLAQLLAAGKLEVGQELSMLGRPLQVTEPEKRGYYSLRTGGVYNTYLFRDLGIEYHAQTIAEALLGEKDYKSNGTFPRCVTLTGLYKLLRFLYQCEYMMKNKAAIWVDYLKALQTPVNIPLFIDYIQDYFKQQTNTESNEHSIKTAQEGYIIVSRKTPEIRTGDPVRGITVPGRHSKVTIAIGHLSYTAIIS